MSAPQQPPQPVPSSAPAPTPTQPQLPPQMQPPQHAHSPAPQAPMPQQASVPSNSILGSQPVLSPAPLPSPALSISGLGPAPSPAPVPVLPPSVGTPTPVPVPPIQTAQPMTAEIKREQPPQSTLALAPAPAPVLPQPTGTGPLSTSVSQPAPSGALPGPGSGSASPVTQPGASAPPPLAPSGVNVPNATIVTMPASEYGSHLYRPLNVKDALSYLDEVKRQFEREPDVYNRFLDIMKDFKAMSIDTPGVIHRVSTLFRSHPPLIVGFNTFLPPGYRIEPGPTAYSDIKVYTPQGVMSVGGQGVGPVVQEGAGGLGGAQGAPGQAGGQPGQGQGQPQGQGQGQEGDGFGYGQPKPQVEFNHAISYVNKIKNRFASEPDTYKQFLEILQTYQKEQKPIQEVYAQVQLLFKTAPDLLEEFKQFLPDNSAPGQFGAGPPPPGAPPPGAPVGMSVGGQYQGGAPRGGMPGIAAPLYPPQPDPRAAAQPPRPPAGAAPIPPASATASGAPYHAAPIPQHGKSKHSKRGSIGPGISEQSSSRPAGTPAGAGASGAVPVGSSQPPPKKKVKTEDGKTGGAGSSGAGGGSQMEVEFFEKVRKAMPKPTYNDFLKLLNMFSQEIIDVATLVERARPFLARSGSMDLFEFLKRLVKYEEEEAIYNVPAPRPEMDLKNCRRSGRSYRMLPPTAPRPTCSGREPSHQEVLNDDWMSHPVVQSEERDTSSNRYRNTFEESLHKAEDERYEFDLNIQSNLHVIAVLEPIAKKIAAMTPEEKAKFKLEEGLGGTSGTIYKRVIKKVYDGARGAEVLKLLHEHPAVTVPVVLRRLQQKDEEWKRAQREWQKVWRQIDTNNYQKALDYQAFSFKADDKKKTALKSLVTEIEQLAKEQEKKQQLRSIMGKTPPKSDVPLANRYQMRLGFKDPGVFEDVRRVINCGIDCTLGINDQDKGSIREFFDGFVNAVFGVVPSEGGKDGAGSGSGGQRADGDGMDIEDDLPEQSGDKVPGEGRVDGDGERKTNGTAAVVPKLNGAGMRNQRLSFQLYGNTGFYVFFRLFHLLYDRMLKMKLADQELNKGPKEPNQIAVELGLVDKMRHDATQKIRANRYFHLLNLVETLLTRLRDDPAKNQTYTNAFEEDMRELYQTTGYHMYTVDRLILQIVKHVQSMLADPPSQQLLGMFWQDRKKETYSPKQEAKYRMEAEKAVGESEQIFRMEYVLIERILLVQLLGKDDLFADTTFSSEEKWSLYVEGFTQITTGAPKVGREREPFLKRSLPNVIPEQPQDNVDTISGLELKICLNTYRIFFVENTEDYFARRDKVAQNKSEFERSRKIRSTRFRCWEDNRIKASFKNPQMTIEKNDGLDLLLGQGAFTTDNCMTKPVVDEDGQKGYVTTTAGEPQDDDGAAGVGEAKDADVTMS
ncbi:hypothetical protein M427DRAFT_154438 [Gonapodya prolifera JEL478]|uniref:Histone deacetylase interacting domain-containing protein n=1 Tax=Gonapodya prolifera (strain JEL478) TaxID=1344416 RepID=A0A139AIX8_GONPJ|nr:hypothetical protein M427DRAFT_154438 [Gonapodya prolifera JEL478]|eukprot:KXS16514.1 hypothetical protein M427DRAFT_154438 [Gonapodya prolifera JEL478]